MPVNDPVMMLGLFPNITKVEIDAWLEMGHQIWTLNDFYMTYPWLKPHAIWQVHPPECIKSEYEARRWLGNWRAVYAEIGATVYTCYDDPGAEYKLHKITDEDLSPGHNYQNSLCYMMSQAQKMGVKHMEIRGVHMLNNLQERNFQIRAMVQSIDLLRDAGITVETQRFCGHSYYQLWDHFAPADIPIQIPYHERGRIGQIPPATKIV